MAYTYSVPISLFPGGVAPSDIEEFADRVDDDVTVTVALEEPRVKYVQITTSPAIGLVFVSEPSAGEKTTIDTLAGDAPGAVAATAASWLADIDASNFRGYYEDFGAVTSTSAGPDTRMDESPTLIGGRYEITWTSEVSGSVGSNGWIARFVFDRGNAEEFIDEHGTGTGLSKFNGRIELVLPAGTYQMELEIEKDSGGGSSQLGKSTMKYAWKGPS